MEHVRFSGENGTHPLVGTEALAVTMAVYFLDGLLAVLSGTARIDDSHG